MHFDYAYVVCAQCGAGFDYEELAQNKAQNWRELDVWQLTHGRKLQPYLRHLWVPLCTECGSSHFHPMIDADEILEYLEDMIADGSLLSEDEERRAAGLIELWKRRQAERDARWRAAAKEGEQEG